MLLTIESAGRLLDLFTPLAPERGVTEVAAELGVSKSKAHALLASLAAVGLLRRTDGGRYRLGWRVLSLSRVLEMTTEFRRHARPIMRALHHRFGETVHLAALDGGQVVYVDRIEGVHSVRIAASGVGSVLPAHCSAVGKVLLSKFTEAELEALIDRHPLQAFTPNTITDPDELGAQVREAQLRGYATDLEEAVLDVSCVAAPIVATGPRVVAAISMSVPSYRFSGHEDAFRRGVMLAGQHISLKLRETEFPPLHAADRSPVYAGV
ncbi:MAG: IclR family transcriptional regulator [Solirubrobacteraceae bacterium]